MKSTAPAATALCGMPPCRAESSLWANVIPPSALISLIPAAPSEAVPERMIPIALLFWSRASERRKPSTGMCWPRTSLRGLRRRIPADMVMSTLGGIT